MCMFTAIGDKEKVKSIIKEQFEASDHKNWEDACKAVIGMVDLFEDPPSGASLKVDVDCHAHHGFCNLNIQQMTSTYTQ